MRHCHPTHHCFERRLVLLAVAIFLCGTTPLFAQPAVVDPVQEIRGTLRAPIGDLAKRDHLLNQQIQAMNRLSDLARALVLREWRDEDQDRRVAAADRPNRLALDARFQQAVREVLRQGDEASQLAVMKLLAEMGSTMHGVGTRHGIVRGFGPDLVELTWRGDVRICALALRTLGQIDPEPRVALSAFSGMLAVDEVNLRLAAADGLVCWMRTLAELATRPSDPGGVEVSPSEFVAAARAIVPVAARGLDAEQAEIRRRSIQTIGYAATALQYWTLAARSAEAAEDPDSFRRRTEYLLPLLLALKEEGPELMHALADPDGEVRYRAGWVLEDMTVPRQLLLQYATRLSEDGEKTAPAETSLKLTSTGQVSTGSSSEESEVLRGTVEALTAQLREGDLPTRRAALDHLEALGPDAAPATVELVGALGDRDKFVRWAAARTLGRIGPVAESVVPWLAQLLIDDDLDVRLAAAAALERFGPAAKIAIGDLCRTLGSTEAELRLAALRALRAIGAPDACPAIPEIAAVLHDADARIGLAAAEVLGRFGPAAREAVPALGQVIQEGNPEVQRAASEALLNILRPGKQ